MIASNYQESNRHSFNQSHIPDIRREVRIYTCPVCSTDMCLIELISGNTTSNQHFGKTLIKCRAGCTKQQIINACREIIPPFIRSTPRLTDTQFLEVLIIARYRRKKITAKDRERELSIRYMYSSVYARVMQKMGARQ